MTLIKTQGIILNQLKYGDTSLICTILTEALGVQKYLIKGVRTPGRKRTARANLLQNTSILDMVVYHNPEHNGLQYIRDFSLHYIYRSIQADVVTNSIALFAMETASLLTLVHEPAAEIFFFTRDFLIALDHWQGSCANMPLYYLMHCGKIAGYAIAGHYQETTPWLDLTEGAFTARQPVHPPFAEPGTAKIIDRLLHTQDIKTFSATLISPEERKNILNLYLNFLELHAANFHPLKTPAILEAILN